MLSVSYVKWINDLLAAKLRCNALYLENFNMEGKVFELQVYQNNTVAAKNTVDRPGTLQRFLQKVT